VFAGIISQAAHRQSKKNGNPFGSIVVEDYDDSIALNLFSENYLKFKHLLVQDTFVYIMAKVKPKYGDDTNLDIEIINIILLDEISEKKTKHVQVSLALKDLSESLINNLGQLIEKNPGKIPLRFVIDDSTDGISVEMYPRRFKVDLSNGILTKLGNMSDIKVKLIS
jgi:DNA polymerase-3 subunit alpha